LARKKDRKEPRQRSSGYREKETRQTIVEKRTRIPGSQKDLGCRKTLKKGTQDPLLKKKEEHESVERNTNTVKEDDHRREVSGEKRTSKKLL